MTAGSTATAVSATASPVAVAAATADGDVGGRTRASVETSGWERAMKLSLRDKTLPVTTVIYSYAGCHIRPSTILMEYGVRKSKRIRERQNID
jgi:hypothetical protein